MCLPVHRIAVDDDGRAGPGLLRIGATANCGSVLYGAVRPCSLVGLSDLCFQPHTIFGRAHDLGRGARPCHKRLRYDRTVVSLCPADIRTSRSTTSQPVKLSSASRLPATDACWVSATQACSEFQQVILRGKLPLGPQLPRRGKGQASMLKGI